MNQPAKRLHARERFWCRPFKCLTSRSTTYAFYPRPVAKVGLPWEPEKTKAGLEPAFDAVESGTSLLVDDAGAGLVVFRRADQVARVGVHQFGQALLFGLAGGAFPGADDRFAGLDGRLLLDDAVGLSDRRGRAGVLLGFLLELGLSIRCPARLFLDPLFLRGLGLLGFLFDAALLGLSGGLGFLCCFGLGFELALLFASLLFG